MRKLGIVPSVRTLSATLGIFALLSSTSVLANEPKISRGWNHYVSLRYRYSIDYPAAWASSPSRKNGRADTFQAPPFTARAADISVLALPAGNWVSLETVKSQEIAYLKTCGKVLSAESTAFAGHPAWRFIANCPLVTNNQAPTEISTVFLASHRSWWVGYLAFRKGDFRKYQATADTVLSSFRLLSG